MKSLRNIGAKLSVLPLLAMPGAVFAQQSKLKQLGGDLPIAQGKGGNLIELIGSLIRWGLGFVGLIFFVLVLYAGFLYMTAAGDDDKVGKAKTLITQAIIGLVIVVASYAIATFVTSALSDVTQTTIG